MTVIGRIAVELSKKFGFLFLLYFDDEIDVVRIIRFRSNVGPYIR